MKNALYSAWLPLLAHLLVACGDPVVGTWENRSVETPDSDLLTLDDDGTGRRSQSFQFTLGSSGTLRISLDYDVTWFVLRDTVYEIEHRCDRASVSIPGSSLSGCSDVNQFFIEVFGASINLSDLECDYLASAERLDCQSSGGAQVEFQRRP